jgi:predicted secreted protein
MFIGAAIVLFPVIWFMLFLIFLPLKMQSQSEVGDVVEGTPASAPADPKVGKKAIWATIITIPVWIVIYGIIKSGIITVDMLDIYNGI